MKVTFDLQDASLDLRQGHLRMGQKRDTGESVEVTNRYLLKDGQPWIPVMGEFHYSRYDRSEWEQELLKMKAGGIQIVSSYLIWLHHEEEQGTFVFEGDRDLRYFTELCKKHGLYVLARLGPWVHGEVRNGGFPDWVLKERVRTNDEHYLFFVKRLYQEYYHQLKDLLYITGGPVIGIQLENELVDNPEHLLRLKEIAVETGFIVPLYTVTAWAVSGVAQFPEYEVIPVFGSYPEAPWRQNLDPFERKPHYLFAPGRNDITIGSDLIKGFQASQTEEILEDYPFAYCELGPGVQVTYHRRPVIRPYDLYSIVIITLAKGNNLPGYYVYHGGRNPGGELKLYQESRNTGYPNDLPVISYDFQAPIGEYGFIRPSYHYYRLIHLFLEMYGSSLASCMAHYPDIGPRDRKDTFTPRCAVRTDEQGSGYLFFNTNQRNEQLDAGNQIRICLKHGGKERMIPSAPLDIPDGVTCFFPINQPLGDGVIAYGLVQPVTEVTWQGEQYRFFTAIDGISPELLLQGDMKILNSKGNVKSCEDGYLISELPTGSEPAVTVTSAGKNFHIVILTFMDALKLYRTEFNGQTHLLLSDTPMYFEKKEVVLYGEANEGAYQFGIFPPLQFREEFRTRARGLFTCYHVPLRESRVSMSLLETENVIAEDNPYVPFLFADDLKNTKEYLLHVSVEEPGDMEDVRIYLTGEFDVMQIYEDQELTGDCFHTGGLIQMGLKRHAASLLEGKPVRIKIAPYVSGKQVFLEQKIERDKTELSLYQWNIQYKKRLTIDTE